MRTRLLLAAFVAALVSALLPTAGAQTFLRVEELGSLSLLNTVRAANGLGRLAENAGLNSMARAQAVRMAQRGQIYHNPNLGSDADATGLRWLRVGENVGVGPGIAVIHQAFLDSPSHRDNMLQAVYNAVGVGVVPGTGAKAGLVFVAHVFAQVTGLPRVESPAAPPSSATARPSPARPSSRPLETPPTPPRPRPHVRSATPNAVIGGVVDQGALVGIALPR